MSTPNALAVVWFRRRPAAVAGPAVIDLFAAVAILAPVIAPYNPTAMSWSAIRKAPSAAHWMGTDENGREVLSRVFFGARASLLAGVVSVLIAAGIGVPAGLLAGFMGGWVDAVLSRVVDAMPPQHRPADPGAGQNVTGRRDDHRGVTVLPGAGPAAASTVLGVDAEHSPAFSDPGAVAGVFPQGWRSFCACSRSTWLAAGCGSRLIHAAGRSARSCFFNDLSL